MGKKLTLRQANKRLYYIWVTMRYRCNTPTCERYEFYGGRGITYTHEWELFENFYEWAINNGYTEELTLDRIDTNGNYEPSNCRWATYETQNRNMNRVHQVTINGETKRIKEWCEIYNINYETVMTRYASYGWDLVKAITDPVKHRKKPSGFKG